MKIIVFVLFVLIPLTINSQESGDCNELKFGVFEIYENEEKIGIIFRNDKYQIEKYPNTEELTIGKIKSDKCKFYIKSYKVKNDLDTITWVASYKKEQNYYSFEAKPLYLKISYKYEGRIMKVSNEITDKRILNTFLELEKKE